MTFPTATVTGRVVGPDGLGRMGRVTFLPTTPTAPPPDRAIVAGQASFRIDPDGYLVGPEGRSVTILPGDYEIDLNIPGDSGAHIRRRATISAGQALTLADLLTDVPWRPPTLPRLWISGAESSPGGGLTTGWSAQVVGVSGMRTLQIYLRLWIGPRS